MPKRVSETAKTPDPPSAERAPIGAGAAAV
jgi:hypothetical protein